MKKHVAKFLATAAYIGFIPGAPGTYASIATTLGFWLLIREPHRVIPEVHLAAVCLVTIFGVLASAEVSRRTGLEDPQQVVIDEVAGQLITFLFLPGGLLNLVAGTIFFRGFDIWKPFPIRKLERLGNGVGIMADDLLAGVYANVLLRFVDWLMLHHFSF